MELCNHFNKCCLSPLRVQLSKKVPTEVCVVMKQALWNFGSLACPAMMSRDNPVLRFIISCLPEKIKTCGRINQGRGQPVLAQFLTSAFSASPCWRQDVGKMVWAGTGMGQALWVWCGVGQEAGLSAPWVWVLSRPSTSYPFERNRWHFLSLLFA